MRRSYLAASKVRLTETYALLDAWMEDMKPVDGNIGVYSQVAVIRKNVRAALEALEAMPPRRVRMTNSASERKCPLCGETDIESRGVIATDYPRRIADLAITGHGKRMMESKFRCRSCGHEFVQIEDHHF